MRLCLSLGVVPVFAPVSEHGFQAAIEGYNGLWQGKVWARFAHTSLRGLAERSANYVEAHHHRCARRQEGAPPRRLFPQPWRLDLQAHPADYSAARLVIIRRTASDGSVHLLGRRFEVSASWSSRLVRCEVDMAEGRIRFYQLRRRAHREQPLLTEATYRLPRRRFAE